MNPLLAEKMRELLHPMNSAQVSPDPKVELARTTSVQTPVQSQMALEKPGPSKHPRLYDAQHAHQDYDRKIHEDFLVMNQKIGTRDAVKLFVMRGVPERTVYNWAERGPEGLPPPGMLRQPGAGRPPAYMPSASRAVTEQLNLQAAASLSHIGPLQVKAAFAEHSRSHSWDGKRFMYSTSCSQVAQRACS